MTTVVSTTTPNTNQVVPATTSIPNSQFTFKQMVGQILEYRPDMSLQFAQTLLNSAYRQILDRRNWYGLMVRGALNIQGIYTTGTATVANGNATVTGVGTAWTAAMVGYQFRTSYVSPYYTIQAVDPVAQTLTLDLPYGATSQTSTGYSIVQCRVSLGANVKYVLEFVNSFNGWRCALNVPQKVLNQYDTYRSNTGWTYVLANCEPSAAGETQYELYPCSISQQTFSYLVYTNPPKLTDDDQCPAAWVRGDVIVSCALMHAMMWKKNSPYYDPALASMKKAEYMFEVEEMMKQDDNKFSKDYQWQQAGSGGLGGANWAMGHTEGPFGDQGVW